MESDHRLRENPNLRHPSGFQTDISTIRVSKSSLWIYLQIVLSNRETYDV